MTDSDRAARTPSTDVGQVPSEVLARLIEEVADGAGGAAASYNRTYNRHNR